MNKILLSSVAIATASLIVAAPKVNAASLDLTSITPGAQGSFSGTLGGISVTGSITGTSSFLVNNLGSGFADSVIDNTSPQFANNTIYTPSQPLSDKVGYTMFPPNGGTGLLEINFSAAVNNPVFHIANLDSMTFDFSPTAGLGGLQFLSGNSGSDGDGLVVAGNTIKDGNPLTIVGVAPSAAVPTTGARSAYGSVQLLGTFTSIKAILAQNPATGNGDGGAFTITAEPAPTSVPEPGTMSGIILIAGTALMLKKKLASKQELN